jgi:hypothetical protein
MGAPEVEAPIPLGDLVMNKDSVRRLRDWCCSLLIEGVPEWARQDIFRLMNGCNYCLLDWEEQTAPPEIGEQLWEEAALTEACGVCVLLARRAPAGWHHRMMRRAGYRRMISKLQ